MDKYFHLALYGALDNPIEGLPRMAAVLVTKDGGIFIGQNKRKTHPLQARFGRNSQSIYLHAEIDALVKAARMGKDLRASTMYIARVKRDGKKALAKPCKGCQEALMHFNIGEVQWT